MDQKECFSVSLTIKLRNVFKSKVDMNGKSVRQVLEDLMKEYIKK